MSGEHSPLALACAAWNCSEAQALQTMQELATPMPRQLVFDADFWPSLHVTIQTRRVTAAPVPEEFHAKLAEALATLGSHELSLMRLDFMRFPAVAGDEVDTRLINVGAYAQLRWSFQGAKQDAPFHAIAGARIVVSGIVWL